MTRYHGGETVVPGIYLNLRQLVFRAMDDAGRLPGTKEDAYRRVPTPALLLAAPLLGLTYVIFLPLIGFALLAWVVGRKALDLAARAVAPLVRVLTPVWKPAMAFLSRGGTTKPSRRPAPASSKKSVDAWAEDVRKQLEKETDEPTSSA